MHRASRKVLILRCRAVIFDRRSLLPAKQAARVRQLLADLCLERAILVKAAFLCRSTGKALPLKRAAILLIMKQISMLCVGLILDKEGVSTARAEGQA